MRLLLLLK